MSVERAAIVSMLVVLGSLAVPGPAAAQPAAAERDALVRLRVERGGTAEEVDALVRVADEAAAKGLPRGPIASKIREGLSKGADPMRIEAVIRQLAGHLETADRLVRDLQPAASERESAVTLLADALSGGVEVDEVNGIRQAAQTSGAAPLSGESLAGAAKGLSLIKEAKLPAAEGASVMAEAARQGFRPHELIDLGRQIKRRERDYREGRSSLAAVREAIARGSRPDQLFRDRRPAAPERPAAARPDPAATRPEPARPERPERPVRPERPAARTR